MKATWYALEMNLDLLFKIYESNPEFYEQHNLTFRDIESIIQDFTDALFDLTDNGGNK